MVKKDSRFGYYDGDLSVIQIQLGDKRGSLRLAIPPEDLDVLVSMYLDSLGI